MKLKEIVQNVMSAFSLEEVNSIEEVPESIQIAEIVKETYYEIISHREWEFLNTTFSLLASGDNTKPVLMTIPSSVTEIKSLRYLDEKTNKYEDVLYLSPEDFLNNMNGISSGDNVDSITGLLGQANIKVKVFNDRQPKYFTTFDESVVIFDAYNSDYDVTLQESKTLAYGNKYVTFLIDDDYEVFMPDEMIWSYLLPEVKSVASVNILQTVNQKEEQRSRRGRFRMYHAHPKTTDNYRRVAARYGRK